MEHYTGCGHLLKAAMEETVAATIEAAATVKTVVVV
jgi:hypothetical protein